MNNTITNTTTYNGWSNWDTWNTYNWITDDELMYRRAARSTDGVWGSAPERQGG